MEAKEFELIVGNKLVVTKRFTFDGVIFDRGDKVEVKEMDDYASGDYMRLKLDEAKYGTSSWYVPYGNFAPISTIRDKLSKVLGDA